MCARDLYWESPSVYHHYGNIFSGNQSGVPLELVEVEQKKGKSDVLSTRCSKNEDKIYQIPLRWQVYKL